MCLEQIELVCCVSVDDQLVFHEQKGVCNSGGIRNERMWHIEETADRKISEYFGGSWGFTLVT